MSFLSMILWYKVRKKRKHRRLDIPRKTSSLTREILYSINILLYKKKEFGAVLRSRSRIILDGAKVATRCSFGSDGSGSKLDAKHG
jgi:hypothetical protein